MDSVTRTVRMVVDPTGVVAGSTVASGAIRKTEIQADLAAASNKRLGASFATLGTTMLGLASAAAAFKAVNIVQSYDKQLAATKAVTKATDEEIKMMDKAAKALGASTKYTATQAMASMEVLRRAGRTTAEAVDISASSLNLATAESLGLDEAAGYLTDTLKQFRMDASESGDVADMFSTAAASASTSVQQLAEGMKDAGSISKLFGWDLQQTLGILDTWAERTLRGSEAGTAFRTIFGKLTDPQATKATLSKIGLDPSDVDPTKNSPDEIIRKLNEAGLSLQEANKLVGIEMGSKLMDLVENYDVLAEMIKKVGDYHGETARKAKIMADTIAGGWDKIFAAVEAVVLKKSEAEDLPALLKSMADGAVDFIKALGGINTGMEGMVSNATKLGEWVNQYGGFFGSVFMGAKFGGPWGAVAGALGYGAFNAVDIGKDTSEANLRGKLLDEQIALQNAGGSFEGGPQISGWSKEKPAWMEGRTFASGPKKTSTGNMSMMDAGLPFVWGMGRGGVVGDGGFQSFESPEKAAETKAIKQESLAIEKDYVEVSRAKAMYEADVAFQAELKTEWEERYGDLLQANQDILDGQGDTLEGLKARHEEILAAQKEMPEEAERLLAIEEEIAQKIEMQTSIWANVTDGARLYREEMSGIKTLAWDVAQMFQTVENQIVEAFMKGEFQARQFFNSVVQMVQRLAVEKMIAEPIVGVLSSVVGGIAGGIGASVGGSTPGSVTGPYGITKTYGGGASGGYTDGLLTGQVANAYAFSGAQSFAGGGRPDGIPIIAHPNEAVVQLNDGRAIPVEQRGGSGGNVFAPRYTTVVVPGVTDATSFNQSKGRLIRSLRNA